MMYFKSKIPFIYLIAIALAIMNYFHILYTADLLALYLRNGGYVITLFLLPIFVYSVIMLVLQNTNILLFLQYPEIMHFFIGLIILYLPTIYVVSIITLSIDH